MSPPWRPPTATRRSCGCWSWCTRRGSRRLLRQAPAGGSPLAAYDAASDSALLLDVARYKYPAVWVPLTQLYAGAQSVDNVSRLSRGIVIVGARTN